MARDYICTAAMSTIVEYQKKLSYISSIIMVNSPCKPLKKVNKSLCNSKHSQTGNRKTKMSTSSIT